MALAPRRRIKGFRRHHRLLVVALLSAVACGPTSDDPTPPPSVSADRVLVEVQGHRGARGLKPENTLPAFELALDLLVPVLEFDLHLTADGHLVVWHDPQIEATKCEISDTNGEAPPAISALALAEVSKYRCDRNPDPERFPNQDNQPTALAGDNFRIVTLEQLFDFVDLYASSDLKTEEQRANAARVHFNMETKRVLDNPEAIGDDFDGVNAGAFELAILDEVTRPDLHDRVTIQSFDHRSLWAAMTEAPEVSMAALSYRTIPHLATLVDRGGSLVTQRSLR